MCDYAIVVSYLPKSVGVTHVVMKWPVREDAQEGIDYNVRNLRWLWDETTKQDKSIIELVDGLGLACRAAFIGVLPPALGLETAAWICALASTIGIACYAVSDVMARSQSRLSSDVAAAGGC
jgi:phenylpropionate dioxygenase-like ring-hydroxylating dioxygenase large terminal subunit